MYSRRVAAMFAASVMFGAWHMPQAHAQEADMSAFSEAVEQAKEAYTSGDFPAAITHLRRANMIQPDARLLLNIARSYEKLDDCALALAYYKAFINDETAPPELVKEATKTFKRDVRKCKSFSDELSGRVLLRVSPADVGARVRLDDETLGAAPQEVIALAPGEHVVKVQAQGYKPLTQAFTVEPGQPATTLNLKLDPIPEPEPEPEPEPTPEPTPEPKLVAQDKPLNIPAIAIMGGGVAALGVGVYMSLGYLPPLDEQRENATSQAEFDELTAKTDRGRTVGLVSYIAGGLLLAGGATWLLLDMMGDEGEGAQLAPMISPDGASVSLRLRF